MHLCKVYAYGALVLALAAPGAAAPRLSRTGNERVISSLTHSVPSSPAYRPAPGRYNVLFVEDPGDPGFGPAVKPDTVWQRVLEQVLGPGNFGSFGPTTNPDENGPSADTMANYCLVIWNCYDYFWSDPDALTAADLVEIASYLGAGGKVWLIGQDVLYSGVPYSWMETWFHLQGANEDYVMDEANLDVHGLAEINCITLNITADYQANNFFPDELLPDTLAHSVLEDIAWGVEAAIYYAGTDFMSSFWAVDCRSPVPWGDWVDMVAGMIDAFECLHGVEEDSAVAHLASFGARARPNPSGGYSVIRYTLPVSGHTSLRIYDIAGRLIGTLVENVQGPGDYEVTWDGRDSNGRVVKSGVYLYRLESGGWAGTEKLIVLR